MQTVLVLGAGRSCTSLINYLIEVGKTRPLKVIVADQDIELARKKVTGISYAEAKRFDVFDETERFELINKADLVISMLPAAFHIHVANVCASLGKSMLTASYVTSDIQALAPQFESSGSTLIMEMGLDPGIDHMSAMQVLDRIKSEGFKLTGFETFTGGLLAPSEEDNPWEYKFTWNPRNVVMAGNGYVKFIQEGLYKYIPYHRLFKRTEVIHIPGYGYFEGYANRDSLKYLDSYDLHGIRTLYRGTLRRPGFCKAWDVFIQLGATNDSYEMHNVADMTHRQFINSFLSFNPNDSVELKLAHYLNLEIESEVMYKLKWLDLFEEIPVGLDRGTPAQVLEHILKKKWSLRSDDKDMIVMWHKFDYLDKTGEPCQIQSHMVVTGVDEVNTAMSKTVGLPLGVTAKLWLQGKINTPGLHIPTSKEIYEPVLGELETMGVRFEEREIELAVKA
ncbi:MAG: saccharopine dehydrogenase C-terminal domain-containing protein [Cyclobacteriaceae bacterium]